MGDGNPAGTRSSFVLKTAEAHKNLDNGGEKGGFRGTGGIST